MLDGGYVVSNGNNCTTNITNGFTHFVTNGNGNRIITTGKNIIDSKGIDNEIVMLGDHIFFMGTDGSTVICAGKEKMVVGNGELMADTWYTYDYGVFKYNEIKNDIYNTVKKIQSPLNWHKTHIEWLRNISAGTVDYTNGGEVRLACKHSSVKSEAHKSLACW